MRKILLTALYQAGRRALGMVMLTFLCSAGALAKNNCGTHASLINPAHLAHSGIGGTGAAQSGIGGTGLYDGGIGGTGSLEGGIGGTGNVAHDGGIGGTGIIGIITGFASICVNGVEIRYDINTPVTVDGRLSTARDLAAGQVVAVRAFGAGQELTAQTIAVMHAAVGPVSSLNPARGEMQVLGQTVQTGQSGNHDELSNLRTGDWVQVSGHRLSNGTIVASRIETTPPRQEARLNGQVTQIDSQSFEVNGTRIHHDAKLLPSGLTRGMEVSVAGHWDGALLKAQHIQLEPTRQSIGNVDHMVIEGYVHALDDKELNLSNRIIALDPNTQITGNVRNDLKVDQRIQISGRPGADQRINPEWIEIKYESPPQIQIQERSDLNEIDGSSRGKRDLSGNVPEAKSIQGNRDNQSDSGSKNELRKDAGHDSDKDHVSGGYSRTQDSSTSLKNEQKSDHFDSSARNHEEKIKENREHHSSDHKAVDKPDKPIELDSVDKFTDHRETLRDIAIPDRVRDHDGHQDRFFDR